ncbi:multiple sugar transport system substrate-binding protein [Kribbella amoyensis]|uniref:Multiple sugar transport system substrate-binding protein n=1 Tax=Kribbella amoyensis TaxID=996641 RepID=A0A561BSC6_9ACTN|nr:ABC transporter substrate-binding protein [Kribbella amoyensis]TWD81719.1 multiple sugar transport system substrate-binding protein [Kribbella amoyensis]
MPTASDQTPRWFRQPRRSWVLAALAPLLAVTAGACGAAAPEASGGSQGAAESGKLVVWDWHSGDAKTKAYYDKAKTDFEGKHPGVEVEFVAQPYDQYYTLLGTAIQAGKGPDLAMFNGGAQLRERAASLIPLDEKTKDLSERLTGWDAFKDKGTTYAVPITLQGFPFYYNKSVYKKAGLDPEKPPASLAELKADCAAIKKAGTACFNLGNKEGLGIEFFLSGFAPGVFSPQQYDAWLAGKRDWSSPEVKQIFQLWKSSNDEGWYNQGVNSTAMFMDQFTMFSGGKGGNVIGLISDTAHWKDFDEFLGPDLGVYQPPVLNPANATKTYLPAEGGIGYGVMKWTKNQELAVDLVKSLASTDALKLFYGNAGAIAADTTIDTSDATVPAVKSIVSWLPDSKPLLHTALSAKTLDLIHRLSQQLINGDVTVDQALTQLAASDK